jgi:hypothetical protein
MASLAAPSAAFSIPFPGSFAHWNPYCSLNRADPLMEPAGPPAGPPRASRKRGRAAADIGAAALGPLAGDLPPSAKRFMPQAPGSFLWPAAGAPEPAAVAGILPPAGALGNPAVVAPPPVRNGGYLSPHTTPPPDDDIIELDVNPPTRSGNTAAFNAGDSRGASVGAGTGAGSGGGVDTACGGGDGGSTALVAVGGAKPSWQAQALAAALTRAGLVAPGAGGAPAAAALLRTPDAEARLRRLVVTLSPQQQAALASAWREVAGAAARGAGGGAGDGRRALTRAGSGGRTWREVDGPDGPSCVVTQLSSSDDSGDSDDGECALGQQQPSQQQMQAAAVRWPSLTQLGGDAMAIDDAQAASGAQWGASASGAADGGDAMMVD